MARYEVEGDWALWDNPKAKCWCLMGAVLKVNGDTIAISEALCKHTGQKVDEDNLLLQAVRWNDSPKRRFQDVARFLKSLL